MAVKLTDLQLIYGIAGAREKFEDLCAHLIRAEHPNLERVRIVRGDGGIDAHKGKLTSAEGIDIYQIKFFPAGISESQKNQIRESFKTICQANGLTINTWTLCLPLDLSIEEKRWFDTWSENQVDSGITICPPWGAFKLEGLLYDVKNTGIKEEFFKEEHLAQIRDVSETLSELAREFRRRMPDTLLAEVVRQERSTALARFIREGQQLRTRLNERPLPIQDHNEWVDHTGTYLQDNLGPAYEVRLNDFSGMVFYGDGSERSQMSKSIEGRLRRLHEFLHEINRQ